MDPEADVSTMSHLAAFCLFVLPLGPRMWRQFVLSELLPDNMALLRTSEITRVQALVSRCLVYV